METARGTWPGYAAIACTAAFIALDAFAPLDWGQEAHAPPGMPAAAHASPGVSAKFDDGLYDKIQGWISEAGAAGATGAAGTPPTRNVMIVVDRASSDGRDPDTVAGENKDTVVRILGEFGARDIVRAESLSFVTATCR